MFDIDTGVSQDFSLGEQRRLEFSWQAFNATNSVRYDVRGAQPSTRAVVGPGHQIDGIVDDLFSKCRETLLLSAQKTRMARVYACTRSKFTFLVCTFVVVPSLHNLVCECAEPYRNLHNLTVNQLAIDSRLSRAPVKSAGFTWADSSSLRNSPE